MTATVEAPAAASQDGAVESAPELEVVADPASPGHGALLGVAWAAALLTATAIGPAPTAAVVAPVAAVASASTVRALGERRPLVVVGAAALAAVAPVAAAVPAGAGGARGAAVAAVVIAAAAGALVGRADARPRFAAAVAAPAAGAAGLVLGSRVGGILAMGLAAAVCLWDVANATTGTGPTGGVLGATVATVSTGVLAVLFAAIADPPLSGSRPWLLFGLLAVGAPLGVRAAARLADGARLPALGRLDSAVVAAPLWAAGVAVLLHR